MKTPIIRKVHSCLYWGRLCIVGYVPYGIALIIESLDFLDLKELRLLDRKFLFFLIIVGG